MINFLGQGVILKSRFYLQQWNDRLENVNANAYKAYERSYKKIKTNIFNIWTQFASYVVSITDGTKIKKMSIVMQTHLEIESNLKIIAKRFRQFTLTAVYFLDIIFEYFFYAIFEWQLIIFAFHN